MEKKLGDQLNDESTIKNYQHQIDVMKKNIEEYKREILEYQKAFNELTQMVHDKDAELVGYANQLRSISNSISWKITKPIRVLSFALNPFNGASLLDRVMPPDGKLRIKYEKKKAEKRYQKRVANYYKLTDEQTAQYWKELDKKIKQQEDRLQNRKTRNILNDYEKWIMENELTEELLEKQKKTNFVKNPKISIVVPLYKTNTDFFRELLYSVHCQTYSNWELCLADGSPQALEEIQNICRKDKRIKYKFLNGNKGISENTNEAIKMASGDYIALLDHDDILSLDALHEVVKVINENNNIEFIYSDEDKIEGFSEERYEAYFKSDFAPDTLRSQNYICHLSVFKRELMDKLEGFRGEFDGAQDYDIFLRMSETVSPQNIYHIQKILYHWRMHQESTAMDGNAKTWAFEAGKKALEAHLNRIGRNGTVKNGKALGTYEVEYTVKGRPMVSILIPNKDAIELLKPCVDSILTKTTYENYEIIIIENNSIKDETFSYYHEIEKNEKVKIVSYEEKGFNYSKIINFGVKQANGEYIVQLNNDTELITNNWLECMLGYCQMPEIGAVGVKLYYPDKTVQHGGVLLGLGGIAGHLHKGIGKDEYGYFSKAVSIQNVSAVTAACIMTKKEIYEEIGYMNEELAVAFNDVDLCLRIRKAGYTIIYHSFVEFIHYESKTRGEELTQEKMKRFQGEIETFEKYWKKELEQGDPYYNKNLRLDKEPYKVRTDKVEN